MIEHPANPAGLIPVSPTPTGIVRCVLDRLDAAERDLAAARAALMQVENALITARQRTTIDPLALTTDQVAHLLGLSRSTVAVMISRRDLVSVKVGGSRRVLRRDLDTYLAAIASNPGASTAVAGGAA